MCILRRIDPHVSLYFITSTASDSGFIHYCFYHFFMVRLAPEAIERKTIPVEIRKKLEEHYGLDRPLWEQYLLYFGFISKEVDKSS